MGIIQCKNCINYRHETRNMIGMRNVYCVTKKMEKNCQIFEPTLKVSNSYFLKEIYDNFISYHNIKFTENKHSNFWRIFNNAKIYKRISASHNYYLRFNTEKELDLFYSENIELIKNSDVTEFIFQ